MKRDQLWELSKGTAEGLTLGAGVAGAVIGIVAAFVVVPIAVTIPAVAATGGIFAIFSAIYSNREYLKKKQKEEVKRQHLQQSLVSENEIVESVHHLEDNVHHLQSGVQQIETKLVDITNELAAHHQHYKRKESGCPSTSLSNNVATLFQQGATYQNDAEFVEAPELPSVMTLRRV